jgi:hypothetical protein
MKKIWIICFLIMSILHADDYQDSQICEPYLPLPKCFPGQWNLGSIMTNELNAYQNYIVLGYLHPCFLINGGLNYQKIDLVLGYPKDIHIFSFIGQLGYRFPISRCFNASVGFSGISGNVLVPKLAYSLSAFLGLDFKIYDRLLFSAKIDPYNYAHMSNGDRYYTSFEAGSLTLTYLF